MDFWIYLKATGENIDLASRIAFSELDLRLEASIYRDLGFYGKTLRETETETRTFRK